MILSQADQDWLEHKRYVLNSLDAMTAKMDTLQTSVQSGFGELRTEIAVMKSATPVTHEELEDIVERVVHDKKNPSQTLTRDEIRHIAEESVRAKNGHKSKANGINWEPWRYVVLGAILLGGNRLLEYLFS